MSEENPVQLSRIARSLLTDLDDIYHAKLTDGEEQQAIQLILDAFEAAGNQPAPQ